RRQVAPAWIIEKRSREALPPGFQKRLQCALGEVGTQPILEQVDDAGAGERRGDDEVDSRGDADDERTARVHLDDLAVALEFPRRHGPSLEAPAQAGVLEELARMRRPAVPLYIRRRRRGREALHARTDGNGDHVLLEVLLVANAGVEPRRENVDAAILGGHLEADIGIGGEKARDDARQDEA